MMRLDRLQLDLRPRPNAQALDLGFALLRAHAADAYLAWLILWLPLAAVCGALACFYPRQIGYWMLLPWWFRPLLERAPLLVLSRQVFGQAMSWKEALRAWPRQLGGGWFLLLAGRLFMAGRGLIQPVWMLEGARGKTASERRKLLGKSNTARSAFWFGVACAHFEAILQVGALAFIGFFLAKESSINPFAYLLESGNEPLSTPIIALIFFSFALSSAIVGPIYTSCCFTLYLNRRATLEAWDIELVLRQIRPPVATRPTPVPGPLLVLLAAAIFALTGSDPARAQNMSGNEAQIAAEPCETPDWVKARQGVRTPERSVEQAQLRRETDQLFQSEDLRLYLCQQRWVSRDSAAPAKPAKGYDAPNMALLADAIRVSLIGAAIFLAGWLLVRYRGLLGVTARRQVAPAATEVGGLDIRAESLPDDVAGAVLELWAQGARRAALALLYRATLSRLVSQDGLLLTAGATEGDCLRLADQAWRTQQLKPSRRAIAASITGVWLGSAYGDRWPDDGAVRAQCAAWQAEFGALMPQQAAP